MPDYCPPVEIRAQGTSHIVYEAGGENDPSAIRYQATLDQFPRACTDEAGVLTIDLGISGFLLAGPKGAPGTFTVPIRVEIVQDISTVVFSEVYPTAATLAPGQNRASFTRVERITVPSPPRETMRITLGFEEGG
jgi:hypothetical protein